MQRPDSTTWIACLAIAGIAALLWTDPATKTPGTPSPPSTTPLVPDSLPDNRLPAIGTAAPVEGTRPVLASRPATAVEAPGTDVAVTVSPRPSLPTRWTSSGATPPATPPRFQSPDADSRNDEADPQANTSNTGKPDTGAAADPSPPNPGPTDQGETADEESGPPLIEEAVENGLPSTASEIQPATDAPTNPEWPPYPASDATADATADATSLANRDAVSPAEAPGSSFANGSDQPFPSSDQSLSSGPGTGEKVAEDPVSGDRFPRFSPRVASRFVAPAANPVPTGPLPPAISIDAPPGAGHAPSGLFPTNSEPNSTAASPPPSPNTTTSPSSTTGHSGFAPAAGETISGLISPANPAPTQGPDPARATQFQLAEQPQPGEHFGQTPPRVDPRAAEISFERNDFAPDPIRQETFQPEADIKIYAGKVFQPTQRPGAEWFRNWYDRGQIPESYSWFGFHNPDQFQFIVSGDQRNGFASNAQNGNSTTLFASQLNLDFDLRLTSTERLHWFITPLTRGADSTRWLLDDDRVVSEVNADLLFGFFEGDLGAITGGIIGQTLPADLPFSVGVMPLVVQNGVWMEDAILGVAATMPAQNLPALGISNMDLTFLFGFDQLDSPAFEGDDNAAKIYAWMAWIEAWNGYLEADYAFLEDRDALRDRSYHNIALGWTRRYGLLSNSVRAIANAGQSTDGGANTADGLLLISENSLVTSQPYTVVPYFNLWAGFDRPQSAARQAAAGGVLRNTGILFETDNLTGYPTLDATANNTFGMAAGINMIPPDFSQQLILEAAWLQAFEEDATRIANGNQYGIGARYQLPISNSMLVRADAMYGFLESDRDLHGVRLELRKKF